jgi:hypothetical protein
LTSGKRSRRRSPAARAALPTLPYPAE